MAPIGFELQTINSDLFPRNKQYWFWLALIGLGGPLGSSLVSLMDDAALVPPLGLQLGATRLSLGRGLKWLGLGVSLEQATRVSYRDLFLISFGQFQKHLKPPFLSLETLAHVWSASDVKWCYTHT